MEIQHSTKDGCMVVALAGSIDLFSVSQIQRTLLKGLSEQPYVLICDLSGVRHLDPVCAAVFATVVSHPSSRWPTTSFALCGAQPPVAEILNRLQVPHFLQLYRGVEEAMDAVFARPPYLRDELLLAPTLSAPAAARAFVQQVCHCWSRPSRTAPWSTGPSCWPMSWSPTPWSMPAPTCGCGWSCAATGCIWRSVTAAPGCCGWLPPTLKPRGAAGCGWSSSSPPPGGSTATPTAAKSSGAPSSSNHPASVRVRTD
jgi:anti-anti-sigma factor